MLPVLVLWAVPLVATAAAEGLPPNVQNRVNELRAADATSEDREAALTALRAIAGRAGGSGGGL